MSTKKSDGNGFDGLVAIQLCTKSWPGIVNLTKEDLGMEQVPENQKPDLYFLEE